MIFTDDGHNRVRAILLIRFESKSCKWCCRECFAKDSRSTVQNNEPEHDQGVGFGQNPGYQSWHLLALAPSHDPGFPWLIRTSPINRTCNHLTENDCGEPLPLNHNPSKRFQKLLTNKTVL